MEKQTAVDYFKDELIKQGFFIPGGIYAQAKQMEKEQIIEAWDNGWHEHMNPPSTYITSVDYYNETFKSE